MFTGLVLESGEVLSATRASAGLRLRVRSRHERFRAASLGDSIALNGACMTVVAMTPAAEGALDFDFDVSEESLARTNLGGLKPGSRLHLEASLRLGDEMGGHIVTGHVDGVGRVHARRPQGAYVEWIIEIAGETRKRVAPYLVEKGSWAVDGVSLTVNSVVDESRRTLVGMTLIPHTLEVTRFGGLALGDDVNVEADLLAKYAARALTFKP